jgi:preprotein translocase subunit SecG
MYTFAIIIEVIVAIALMFAVLMQSSKGGGLAGAFGAGNMGAVFGVRRTSDFLVKGTQILATVFIVLALVINLWLLPRGSATRESVIQQAVPAPSTLPPSGAPAPAPAQ